MANTESTHSCPEPDTQCHLWSLTGGLVVVDIDSLQLEVTVAVVSTSWVNAVLVADHFPELVIGWGQLWAVEGHV